MKIYKIILIRKIKAFTLPELLVVLVIIGLLAALVGPNLYQRIKPAKYSVAAAQLENFITAIDSFFIDVGRYPTDTETLQVLYAAPQNIKNWKGPYLKKRPPSDPWDNAYQYQVINNGNNYRLYSFGGDGKRGGEGDGRDIKSWETR